MAGMKKAAHEVKTAVVVVENMGERLRGDTQKEELMRAERERDRILQLIRDVRIENRSTLRNMEQQVADNVYTNATNKVKYANKNRYVHRVHRAVAVLYNEIKRRRVVDVDENAEEIEEDVSDDDELEEFKLDPIVSENMLMLGRAEQEEDDGESFINPRQRRLDYLYRVDPLVLLDALRLHVRLLMTGRSRVTDKMVALIEKEKLAQEAEFQKLSQEKDLISQQYARKSEEIKQVLGNLEGKQIHKEEAVRESHQAIETGKEENQKMVQLIRGKEKELQKLHKRIDELNASREQFELKLMRISQLENDLQSERHAFKQEMDNISRTHKDHCKYMEEQVAGLSKLQAEAISASEKLRKVDNDIVSMQRSSLTLRHKKQLQDIERLQRVLETKEEYLASLRTAVETQTRRSKEIQGVYDQLKIEDGKVRKLIKQELTEVPVKVSRATLINENESHVGYYKKKLAVKARQLEDLTVRVQSLMSRVQRDNLFMKAFQKERAVFQSEFAQQARSPSTSPVRLRKTLPQDDSLSVPPEKPSISVLRNRNQTLVDRLHQINNTVQSNTAVTSSTVDQQDDEMMELCDVFEDDGAEFDEDGLLRLTASTGSSVAHSRPTSASLVSSASAIPAGSRRPVSASTKRPPALDERTTRVRPTSAFAFRSTSPSVSSAKQQQQRPSSAIGIHTQTQQRPASPAVSRVPIQTGNAPVRGTLRPSSAMAIRSTATPTSTLRPSSALGTRPASPQSTLSRPLSAQGRRVTKVGATRSTIQVGLLLS